MYEVVKHYQAIKNMGYTTTFEGKFELTPKLTPAQIEYLEAFANTRRVKRNASIAEEMPDPKREAVGLSIGYEAEYFVGTENYADLEFDSSVVNKDRPPSSQPNVYCHWIPSPEGDSIEWNGGEKFYDYEEWLDYLIEHFLEPWGIVANGTVEYQGEDGDEGSIVVENNNRINKGCECFWM